MTKLLFLSHRIPFPPDKGDKIRSYHVLRHLASRHQVYLGAFVDDPEDWRHRDALAPYCAQVKLVGLNRLQRKLLSLSGLPGGEPLSLPYYRSRELQQWVEGIVRAEGIGDAFVFSSTMAQYIAGECHTGMRRIADFCDVDSDKWRQYAEGKQGVARWIYAREARKLLDYERRIAQEFDATLFVSEAEANLFGALAPEAREKVGAFNNGVDTEYFDPGKGYESPFDAGVGPVVVFTGAMDYWANVDAVVWFAEAIFPSVRTQSPAAQFWIVGSNPDSRVRALGQRPGVRVTGRVPDVRPYLAHAAVAVAPLRIARGTQNKVLEALAMALPVACTPAAAAGLHLPKGPAFRVEESPEGLSRAVLRLLDHGPNPQGREAILTHYSWGASLVAVDRLLAAPTRETMGRVPA